MKTIRELRRERGWTQFELALAVGVQPQTVYLWESGRRLPHVPQMRRLGQVFDLCSDDIVLEPEAGPRRSAPHRARTDRRTGESASVRDVAGGALTRRAEGSAVEGGGSDRPGAPGRALPTRDRGAAPAVLQPEEGI